MWRKIGSYGLAFLLGVAVPEDTVNNVLATIAENGPRIFGGAVVEPIKGMWDNSGDLGIFN